MPDRGTAAAVFVGVDVGGSAVKVGAVSPAGDVLAEESVAAAGAREAGTVLDAAADAVRRVTCGAHPRGIGIGLPGLVDRASGVVESAPNLPWLAGVAVRDELARRLALDPAAVRVENDANAAALGEAWLGAARGAENALVLTLGTGIGGGLVLGGELFVGDGLAGEIGHVVVDPAGPRCGCGARGCLETLASARAAERRARERGLPREAPGDLVLLAARAAGPEGADERALLEEVGLDLGRGLALAVTLLDVRTFVLGGGFAAALPALEPGIRRGLRERAYGSRVGSVRLARAALGPSAGWIGAARLCSPPPRAPKP